MRHSAGVGPGSSLPELFSNPCVSAEVCSLSGPTDLTAGETAYRFFRTQDPLRLEQSTDEKADFGRVPSYFSLMWAYKCTSMSSLADDSFPAALSEVTHVADHPLGMVSFSLPPSPVPVCRT